MESNDYEYDDDEEYSYHSVSASTDYGSDDHSDLILSTSSNNPYQILKKDDVLMRIRNATTKLQELLAVDHETAFSALVMNNWNADLVTRRWFDGDESLLSPLGLERKKEEAPLTCNSCPICYDDMEICTKFRCGHSICSECFKDYLNSYIESMTSFKLMKCPDFKCPCVSPIDVTTQLTGKHMEKYDDLLIHHYMLNNNMRFCPGLDCMYIHEYRPGNNVDIVCHCSGSFCSSCAGYSHRPVSCKMSASWNEKNSSESEAILWIRANTKVELRSYKISRNRFPLTNNNYHSFIIYV